MYKEILRIKAAEGKLEELKAVVKKLAELASASPECSYCKGYTETNNEGWVMIDQEFVSKEAFLELVSTEEVALLDGQMKKYVVDGISFILEEL